MADPEVEGARLPLELLLQVAELLFKENPNRSLSPPAVGVLQNFRLVCKEWSEIAKPFVKRLKVIVEWDDSRDLEKHCKELFRQIPNADEVCFFVSVAWKDCTTIHLLAARLLEVNEKLKTVHVYYEPSLRHSNRLFRSPEQSAGPLMTHMGKVQRLEYSPWPTSKAFVWRHNSRVDVTDCRCLEPLIRATSEQYLPRLRLFTFQRWTKVSDNSESPSRGVPRSWKIHSDAHTLEGIHLTSCTYLKHHLEDISKQLNLPHQSEEFDSCMRASELPVLPIAGSFFITRPKVKEQEDNNGVSSEVWDLLASE